MDVRTVNLVGALVTALDDRIADRIDSVPLRAGATAAALVVVASEPGMSVQALSAVVGISSSGVVRLVDRLVGDGLAERGPGNDARAVAVTLTPAGERLARRVLDQRHRAVAEAMSALTSSERHVLVGIVEKMLAGLTPDERVAERICRLCDLDVCPQDRCPVERALS